MMNRRYLLKKIGAPLPTARMVIDDQDAFDIIARMRVKHKACACEYDKIASDFEANTVYEVARKLFYFCKNNIEYYQEPVKSQYVSSPQTILSRGYSDCKGYALFIGGVLDALNRQGWNINWKYRYASDKPGDEIPGHVFVVINDGGHEVWVDPVLQYFNQDHNFPFYSDRKVTAKISGCDCSQAVGATTAQTGQMIMKIAPALSYIPVVGWIGTAAAEIIGGIISIVGSKWNQSADVRWLIQLFQYYVQGNAGVTADNKVNESLTQTAQAYFSVVLGVPIGGRKDLNILQSGDGNSNTPNGDPAEKRAQNYLIWKNLTGKIPIENVVQAANIARQLNFGGTAGSWAGLYPAPSTIYKDATGNYVPAANEASGSYVDAAGNLIQAAPAIGGNKILLIAAAAVIALIILK